MASTGLCVKCGATNPRTAAVCAECRARLPWADGQALSPRVFDSEPADSADEPARSYPQEVISADEPEPHAQPGAGFPGGTFPGNGFPGVRGPAGNFRVLGGRGCNCACMGCGCLVVLGLLYIPVVLYHWIF